MTMSSLNRRRTLQSLLRLAVSLSVLCIPYISHDVYAFQSMHTLSRSLPTTSTNGSINRFSRHVSPLNASFAERWEKMYDLLCGYSEREGNTNVPQKHKEGGQNLGYWLKTQRQSYKAGKLLPERQHKLESLGVQLEIKSATSWEEMFDLLTSYYEREGHANPQSSHKEGGQNLGRWLSTQRTSYKAGTLHTDRQHKLESLGVQWEIISTATWDEMFDLLNTYNEREGDVNVPKRHKEGGKNLGYWLMTQRERYRAEKLLPERQQKLEALGVQWEINSATSWDEMLDLLTTYHKREGNANVPQKHKEGGQNLGYWLKTQRKAYRAEKLLPERQQKLEALGVQWEMFATQWDEMFDLLNTYYEREGNANVLQRHEEGGQKLGYWLQTQRQSYKAGKLLPERQQKLEALGVQWGKVRSATSWDEMFDLLTTYHKREGNANVPQKHKEGGQNLGYWLKTQRQSYKAGKLLPERQRKLESLGARLATKKRK